ncbi:MAG: hypothetical protein GF329_07880 [Candidatus Lokiarchaeota archaeon]|nr:hypothetical protein [Candidatus Lokiarchaeota archaeon]
MAELTLKYESLVFDIIQEYVNKNRTFNYNTILPFINSRFGKSNINLNNRGIKLIIQKLIKKGLISEGSKLTRTDVLSNPNRKDIFDFIKNNPGIYFNKLVEKLDLNPPVVGWHLKTLLKFKCIKYKKIENRKVYFIVNIEKDLLKLYYTLSKNKCKQIIDYFLMNNSAKKSQISNKLSMHHYTVNKYLDILEEYNLVKKSKKNFIFNIDYYKELLEQMK